MTVDLSKASAERLLALAQGRITVPGASRPEIYRALVAEFQRLRDLEGQIADRGMAGRTGR